MNELQLGLIGLGATSVAGVVAYNKWLEYRQRKIAEQLLRGEHPDVLLGTDPAVPGEVPSALDSDTEVEKNETSRMDEPVLTPSAASLPDLPIERHEPSLRGEPVLDEGSGGNQSFPASNESLHKTPVVEIEPAVPRAVDLPISMSGVTDDEGVPAMLVSPMIDYVARFELLEPVSGDQLLRSQREFLSRIVKPVGWAGFNDRNGQWERVVEEGYYRRVRVGLLLADRQGPLGEADLLTFLGAMQGLAEELMAVVDLPARDSALSAAIALDQFCAHVDIQIGLNLISRGQVFPGTKIRALAEAAGMVLDASGRFVRCDDDGFVLYTLANQESAGFCTESMRTLSTHGLIFTLDVPRVSHGDRVFAQMLDVARRMAETLNGVLVDDNRRPLTEAMLDPFRRQIGQYQSQLSAKGLPAGGPLALRLFS